MKLYGQGEDKISLYSKKRQRAEHKRDMSE